MRVEDVPEGFKLRDLVIAAKLLGVNLDVAIVPLPRPASCPRRVRRGSWSGNWTVRRGE
jgi:hypothetical protein